VVGFEVSHMRRKELAIFNVRRSNHESHDAIEFLTNKAELFAPMITHRRPLADIAGAFNTAEHYADGVGKLVIAP
jgi:L-iditol 2-dehydrogenase